MGSSFTWLDYSEHERRRALDVIDLFKERDTVDELGIGTVRDAFANALFPGTATIQTRARYFLFVPWIYLDLERRRVRSSQAAAEARRLEVRLIEALLSSADTQGVIGKVSKSRLQRLPSSVYWQGLGRLGIRLFPGSQDQYHRSLDRFYDADSRGRRELRNDDGEPVGGSVHLNWHHALPEAPEGFPGSASLSLTWEEAYYLRERVRMRAPGTFLAFLLDQTTATPPTGLPWEHPAASLLPGSVRELLHHARCFSETIHGAALLYNLMLAELSGREGLEEYRTLLERWSGRVSDRSAELLRWDRRQFWETVAGTQARVLPTTRAFVDRWSQLLLCRGQPAEAARRIAEDRAARDLIREREISLKRSQARLVNRRCLELWRGASSIGRSTTAGRWSRRSSVMSSTV